MSQSEVYKDGFDPTVKSSDEARLAEVMEIYSHLEYGNRKDMDDFKAAMGYYTGTGQWSELERQQLESEGRPP